MASIIEQLQERTTTTDEEVRVLELDEEDADEVLDALSSALRRDVFRELFEQPRTMTELAEELDTSVQNVQYHVSALERADLIAPVDTIYSSKGNEVTVYGPASDPIVFVGDETRTPGVERSMTQLVGGLALLGIASLLFQAGTTALFSSTDGTVDSVTPASPESTGSWATDTATGLVFGLLEPGLLFFVAGLVVATLVLLRFE